MWAGSHIKQPLDMEVRGNAQFWWVCAHAWTRGVFQNAISRGPPFSIGIRGVGTGADGRIGSPARAHPDTGQTFAADAPSRLG